ncbi:MAG: hypothetical protein PHG36_09295 [Dehalococcoidia bacterium]|nr:hypothetical protein [Dehalococcoidia bacterium]
MTTLLLPITSLAANYAPHHCADKTEPITIIGESHKKTESIELFKCLVLDTIKKTDVATLNGELEQMFRDWHPGFRAANDEKLKKVA